MVLEQTTHLRITRYPVRDSVFEEGNVHTSESV